MAPSSSPHHHLLLDPLYCPEQHLELDELLPDEIPPRNHFSTQSDPAVLPDEDLAELFASLKAKEGGGAAAAAAVAGRAELAGWAARAAARQGFSALTALLAVDYLDRCFVGGGGGPVRVRGDRPWMGRLAAVACLALAAKVEETHVPLLLDLQLAAAEAEAEEEEAEDEDGMEYLFEARTVRRMELLVLSALSWRMNPVTPLSYIHPLLSHPASAPRLRRCEAVLVSLATDWRWVVYSASVWAAAALLYTAEEYDETHRLVALIDAPKDKAQECYLLVLEHSKHGGGHDVGGSNGNGNGNGNGRKRKSLYAPPLSTRSAPPSPTGVLGSCFSCEASSTSTAAGGGGGDYSVSSSPEPPLPPRKRPNCAAAREDENDGGGA